MLFSFLISGIIIYVLFEASLMLSDGLTARRLGRATAPFCRFVEHSDAIVMCVGDSTAVGTGAQHSTQSVAGRLAYDFPNITVINHGINGASSANLVTLLSQHPEWRADVLIIHIGGIDIMGLRSLRALRSNTTSILRMAKHIAPRVVLVTPQTIRRCVNRLCEQGLLRRVHGGVDSPSHGNLPYPRRQILNLDAKRRIANAVAAFIPDGASVSIGIGTTPAQVAVALRAHTSLRVITNSLNVATA